MPTVAVEVEEKCFAANADFETVLDAAILEDSSGDRLTCSSQNPCTFPFSTGSAIDTSGPNIEMNAPQDGASVIVNSIEALQALAEDDVGVSSVDFDIDGEVSTSGLGSSTEGSLSPDNFFNYDWDTANYVPNSSINISAEGRDCAGNTDSSSTIRVNIRAASCDNNIQDNWETGVDCGGNPQDSKYCGACAGQSCSSNANCSSGVCQGGQCISPTRITNYSPGDAAPDSLVTIEGTGFGTQPGTVTFVGDGTNSVSVTPYQCNGQTQWMDDLIIVQVPGNAASGPILIETDGGETDRTDDDSGPRMSDFLVSQNQRPGLCMLQPNQAEPNTQITVHGVGFGQDQGNSTFYFGNGETQNIAGWTNSQFNAGVPLLNPRTYRTQVFVGDNTCSGSGNVCVDDSDCASGEVCEAGRFGSNRIEFDVLSRQTSQPPVIGSVDTGWRACDAASGNQGARCATDTDCTGGGGCTDVPTWGPPGQYVTITGSDFGTGTGTVQFINNDSNSANEGVTALGSTDFPQACGSSGFWTDDSIVVKVPEAYQNQNQIEFTDHQVVISRAQDAVESDPVDFQIIDDSPGPSLCKLEPSLGPIGTEVDIYGENFEANQGGGTVTFFDGEDAGLIQSWSNDTIDGVEAPQGAQTGPVRVTTDAQYQSNTVPFEVANCNDSGVSCGPGTTCCGDGSCRASCAAVAPKEAHYTYRFSTGEIPEVPRVRIACNANRLSPGPSNQWSNQEDICVNANVRASFTTDMDTGSMASGITVEECTGSTQDPCTATQAVNGNAGTLGQTVVTWSPSAGQFNQNTTYRVTLDSSVIVSNEGEALPGDYSWQFTTRDNTDLCEVGSVLVTPPEALATEQGEQIDDFTATPRSANDRCVPLNPQQYPWEWTLNNNGQQQAQITAGSTTPSPTVTAQLETPPGSPVEVVGRALVQNNPSDSGDLTINFTDPEVLSVRPSCSTACINAKIEARFNTQMASIGLQDVELFACDNALCEQGDLTPVAFSGNANADMLTGPTGVPNSLLSIEPRGTLNADTFYRVVISGGVRSASGVPLSVAGANYFQDYSWIFKTKDSSQACAINRVEVEPSSKQMSYIGERAEFHAVALGAPDECSERGQVLTAQGNWQGWQVDEDDDDDPAETVSILPAVEQGTTDDMPVWCSDSCTLTGTPYQAPQGQCGDNNLDPGEDCDDGNLSNDDGCSSRCLFEGTEACSLTCSGSGASCSEDADCPQGESCELSGSGCCGNGQVDQFEECDDGNIARGDGCSNICTNEGSSAVGGLAECGNGVVDQNPARGGEDCDDGNTENGDGCSSQCLNEGTPSTDQVYAICGNGTVEEGEECDDGNTDDGDLCTSNCTNTGTPQCVQECVDTAGNSTGRNCISNADCSGNATCEIINGPDCCGNGGSPGPGEDCEGGEGCSESCTLLGSSIEYTNPSICGNGNPETGEDPVCENQAGAVTDGPYTAIEVQPGVARELDDNNQARADLTTQADGEDGVSNIAVECSCETDAQCGNSGSLGCGAGSCCFERPQVDIAQPVGTNTCRNPAVWVQFTHEIDLASIDRSEDDNQNGRIEGLEYDPQLFIAKIDPATNRPVDTQSSCQNDLYQLAQDSQEEANIFVRAWRWIADTVKGWFGRSATAQSQEGCLIPVEYNQEQVTENNQDFWKVRLLLPDALESGTDYGVFVRGDDNIDDAQANGLLASSGVGLNINNPQNLELATSFKTGGDICTLDRVEIEDKTEVPFRLSSIAEEHDLEATAYTLRGGSVPEEIQPIPNAYEWDWGWSTEIGARQTGTSCSTDADCSASGATCQSGACVVEPSNFDERNVVDLEDAQPADPKQRKAVGAGNNGKEDVYATARITVDALNQPTTGPACSDTGDACTQDSDCNQGATCELGKAIASSEEVLANLCENPWPANEELWTDDEHNFGFQYCRDRGEDGTGDDLPELRVVEVDPQSSQSASPISGVNILKEYLFIPTDAQDALGVRVIANPNYLAPDVWFQRQGFDGSPEPIELDGYEAIQVGNTVYAAAANTTSEVYSNIYVISTNEDADETSQAIFNQLTETFTLNTNMEDVGLCKDGNTVISDIDANGDPLPGELFSCEWDGDCTGATYQNGDPLPASATCDAQKSKLTRDIKRLTDLRRIEESVDDYGQGNRHCSGTRDQACFSDDQCPGNETCEPDVPDLQEGTFIRAMSTSLWPSWSAQLGNELGQSIPQDPINEFFCDDAAFNADTCFSRAQSAFFCEEGSHAYAFRSVAGQQYSLYGQMEYKGLPWANDVDLQGGDNADYVIEGAVGGLGTRATGGELCGGSNNQFGTSNICGDGVQGQNEECEIGDVQTKLSCTTSGGQQGVYRQVCIDDGGTCRFESPSNAECLPYSCGNGVVEGTEECDAGSQNGRYGSHCETDCTVADSKFCGDGTLAGGEQCDNGVGQYVSSGMEPNGQYEPNYTDSCAFDCSVPGPTCGDRILNGPEECDSNALETKQGPLTRCGGSGSLCESDADCTGGNTCDASTNTNEDACGMETVCEGGSDDGEICQSDADCDETCGDIEYQTVRTRSCDNRSCSFSNWSECRRFEQSCGNGVVEGQEQCDDGNDSNNDACKNDCTPNVCGDGAVYTGVESCDLGSQNGQGCNPPYGGTCNSCTSACKLETTSGGFCGDDQVNGNEICDGTVGPFYCFDQDANNQSQTRGAQCSLSQLGSTSSGICPDGGTCRWTGVCRGGADHGELCTFQYQNTSYTGDNRSTCSGQDALCILPTCAPNCRSACPFSYEAANLKALVEPGDEPPKDEFVLSSYNADNPPAVVDEAAIAVPPCRVTTGLQADVEVIIDEDQENLDTDIVFVTDLSGSMPIQQTEDAIKGSIDTLFDAFSEGIPDLRIGLVSSNSYQCWVRDSGLVGPSSSQDLKSVIEEYHGRLGELSGPNRCEGGSDDGEPCQNDADCAGGQSATCSAFVIPSEYECVNEDGTHDHGEQMYRAIEEANDMLENSNAGKKIVVTMTDTGFCYNKDGSGGCSSDNFNEHALEIYNDLVQSNTVPGGEVEYYVVNPDGDNQSKVGRAKHISSDECDNYNESSVTDPGDCRPNSETELEYVYNASSPSDMTPLYESIASNVVSDAIQVTVTGQDGSSSSSNIEQGPGVGIPLPPGFQCDPDRGQIVPIRLQFGLGRVRLSNLKLSYCPASPNAPEERVTVGGSGGQLETIILGGLEGFDQGALDDLADLNDSGPDITLP